MRRARTRRHPRSLKRTPQLPAAKPAVPKGRPLEEFRADLLAHFEKFKEPPTVS